MSLQSTSRAFGRFLEVRYFPSLISQFTIPPLSTVKIRMAESKDLSLLSILSCMHSLQSLPSTFSALSLSLYDSHCNMLDASRVFACSHHTAHFRVVRSCPETSHNLGARGSDSTSASEFASEANPIFVTCISVALAAACCVTIDATLRPAGGAQVIVRLLLWQQAGRLRRTTDQPLVFSFRPLPQFFPFCFTPFLVR